MLCEGGPIYLTNGYETYKVGQTIEEALDVLILGSRVPDKLPPPPDWGD
jgi:hypothetical protein